jgi:hypothetical protein
MAFCLARGGIHPPAGPVRASAHDLRPDFRSELCASSSACLLFTVPASYAVLPATVCRVPSRPHHGLPMPTHPDPCGIQDYSSLCGSPTSVLPATVLHAGAERMSVASVL